ncbi:lonely Cys domain-containing protein, partial [Streptomyces sp. TRM76130]|nr:lonely Cys domain-containing protein [Streptomyces sp. TRM76130]
MHSAEIIRVFGAGITDNPLYASLLDAVGRLDTLRRAGHGPELDPGPLDLDAVARRVLLLDPGTPVTHDHHGDLFRIALDPAMEQASDLAALAAFGLALRGGLAMPNALTGQDGTPYGRAWTGALGAGHGLDIDPDATTVKVRLPDGREEESAPRPAPWGPRTGQPRPYVVLASGNSHAILVRTRDGARVSAPPAVLAELLAMDPVLSSLPPEVPVLLVVPYAGGRQLELPRALADRLGREVWSTSGQPVLGRR